MQVFVFETLTQCGTTFYKYHTLSGTTFYKKHTFSGTNSHKNHIYGNILFKMIPLNRPYETPFFEKGTISGINIPQKDAL